MGRLEEIKKELLRDDLRDPSRMKELLIEYKSISTSFNTSGKDDNKRRKVDSFKDVLDVPDIFFDILDWIDIKKIFPFELINKNFKELVDEYLRTNPIDLSLLQKILNKTSDGNELLTRFITMKFICIDKDKYRKKVREKIMKVKKATCSSTRH